MNKKRMLLLLTFLTIILTISTANAADDTLSNQTDIEVQEGTIHTVDGSSVNQMDDNTIQQAINNAQAGDTILITGKNYVHCHIIVNKQLNIISEVGTTMSPCPSNKASSGSVGVFYLTPEASNSIIKGFTINNDLEDDEYTVPPYAIYINSANNVKITQCNVNSKYGNAILVKNSKNTQIIDNTIENSINGIKIENTDNTIIQENIIKTNSLSGVNIAKDVNNTIIINNTITRNIYGVNASSSENLQILNNKILDNRNTADQSRATVGAGIYTNCNITNNIIRGNFILENGMYGIFNDYRARNINDEYVQIIDQNFIEGHKQRAVFTSTYVEAKNGYYEYDEETDTYYEVEGTGHYNSETGRIYVWSNIYYLETFCGGTSYSPGVLRSANPYKDLVVGNITQVSPGIYQYTFNYKEGYNNGSVATGLNAVDMTFYLNKNNTSAQPTNGDIYRNVTIVNGTAIADFRNETYLESGNNVSIVGPGTGSFTGGNRPYAFLSVSDIPSNDTSIETLLTQEDLIKTYGDSDSLVGVLSDKNGNPIAGQHVSITLTRPSSGASKTYTTTTNYNGQYTLTINLAPGTYTASTKFDSNGNYDESSVSSNIVISNSNLKPTILTANNVEKVYGDDDNLTGVLTDGNGNVIAGQHVSITLTRPSSGASKTYTTTTNYNGQYTLTINLAPGTYTALCSYSGVNGYDSSSSSASLTITSSDSKKKLS